MFWRTTAILILLVFYSIYIGKMLLQKKQGMQSDQIAKREKRDKIFYTELLMKIATYSVVMAEVVSIFVLEPDLPIGIMITGVLLGIAGDLIFAVAVVTMYCSFQCLRLLCCICRYCRRRNTCRRLLEKST